MGRQISQPLVIAVLAALLGYTWAQGQGVHGADETQAPEFAVAVVDLSKVFSGYEPLIEKRNEQQREIEKATESVKSLLAEAKELQEDLKTHKPGSAEHKRISEELQARAAEFQKFQKQQQQVLLEGQAKMYLWAYERVAEQIQQYADSRGIKLVLQFTPPPVEGKSPQEIMAGMNRQVIYQNSIDITDEIMQLLN